MDNLKLIFNNLKDGILLIDKQGMILEANESAKILFNLPDKSNKITSFFDLDIDSKIKAAIREEIISPNNRMLELELSRDTAVLLLHLKPIYGRDNSFLDRKSVV